MSGMIIERIVDPATLDVITATGERVTVRVLGIQAPSQEMCWAKEASAWAGSTLAAKTLTFPVGANGEISDEQGRWLRNVSLPDGGDYGKAAVLEGMARTAPNPDQWADYTSELGAAEQQSRATKTGLWGPSCTT
jgi:endonuclease YncB( thermonuclease family)